MYSSTGAPCDGSGPGPSLQMPCTLCRRYCISFCWTVPVPPPRRIERGHCSYRNWHHGNKTDWITYTYAVESILIELFQTSEHRTFDPEEADYFFVPTMAGCIYDVFGWNPIPMWPPRIHGEMMFSPHSLSHPSHMGRMGSMVCRAP